MAKKPDRHDQEKKIDLARSQERGGLYPLKKPWTGIQRKEEEKETSTDNDVARWRKDLEERGTQWCNVKRLPKTVQDEKICGSMRGHLTRGTN